MNLGFDSIRDGGLGRRRMGPMALTLASILAVGLLAETAGAQSSPWSHIRRSEGSRGNSARVSGRFSPGDRSAVQGLHSSAERQYRRGDLNGARSTWSEILSIDPTDKRAETYLEETRPEFDRSIAGIEAADRRKALHEEQLALLNSPVTIQTDVPTPLSEFMRLLSFSTVREIEYFIADGADSEVFANFTDRPLRDVLNAILPPMGLTWRIDENDLLTIRSNLVTRSFSLNSNQMAKVRALLDAGTLQQIIWGRTTPPAKGVAMTLDDRERLFTATGSALHVGKVTDFLDTMSLASTPDLETRIYKIREDDGPRVRALVNALISSDRRTAFDSQRKLFIDGPDLIIRDTPKNLTRTEELLLDENFIQSLRREELNIVNLSLIPRGVENSEGGSVKLFAGRVVEAIQTLLYARTGIGAAEAAGRRMWFDTTTMQLTLVDTPTNIERVGRYVDSLPELGRKRRQRVIKIDHAVAETLASELSTVLGLAGSDGTGPGAGEQILKRMRRGDQITFRDLRIRLVRVETGDPQDRNDDQAELSIISGTQSSQLNMTELDTQFFENYEITLEDVQPAGGTGAAGGGGGNNRGEGTIRILIRYIPPVAP